MKYQSPKIPRLNLPQYGQANTKQFPITEIPNSKIRQANVPDFWSLEFGPSDISWYLGFGAWNFLYKILESRKNEG